MWPNGLCSIGEPIGGAIIDLGPPRVGSQTYSWVVAAVEQGMPRPLALCESQSNLAELVPIGESLKGSRQVFEIEYVIDWWRDDASPYKVE